MKKIFLVLCSLFFLTNGAMSQMLTATVGTSLVKEKSSVFRMTYTQPITPRISVALFADYNSRYQLFVTELAHVGAIEYKGEEDTPAIWYDEFERGIGNFAKSEDYRPAEQVVSLSIGVQYNVLEKEKWNLGLRLNGGYAHFRKQYPTAGGSINLATTIMTREQEERPFAWRYTDIYTDNGWIYSLSTVANYKLTSNFWLGVDVSIFFDSVYGGDMPLSVSASYLF
jgi:hypothetical protein